MTSAGFLPKRASGQLFPRPRSPRSLSRPFRLSSAQRLPSQNGFSCCHHFHPPTHMQISPNVRSNHTGGGGEGNSPGSAPWCPWSTSPGAGVTQCPKEPPVSPAPWEMLRHPLHPGGLEVGLGARAAEQLREMGPWGEHHGPCSGCVHLQYVWIWQLVWLLCPNRGGAKLCPPCCWSL